MGPLKIVLMLFLGTCNAVIQIETRFGREKCSRVCVNVGKAITAVDVWNIAFAVCKAKVGSMFVVANRADI